MTEPNTIVTKNPSLKRCFKYMLKNRTMSLKFTSRNIRYIIETDLYIKLQPPQSLYARVCIEAFSHYMLSWPEWNLAMKSQYSGALYDCLVTYLRYKLLYLKPREQAYKEMILEKNTVKVEGPENMQISLINGLKKIRSPYSIKVCIPQHLWNSTNVTFTNYGTNNIYLEMNTPKPSDLDFGVKELLNHPHISAELDIPGLIHFTRNTPFKTETFLQTATDESIQIDPNHIISIEETDTTSPHKVYSYHLMVYLIQALNDSVAKYEADLNDVWKVQIRLLCEEFLLDIFESNVKSTTVCEGSTVNYNIGKLSYYLKSDLNLLNSLKEKVIYKKIITPVVSYNLISCAITQDCLTDTGGFDHFLFTEKKTCEFFKLIKNCLTFKCLLCNILYLSLHDLKNHLIDIHPQERKLKCLKCKRSYAISRLLMARWSHDCKNV